MWKSEVCPLTPRPCPDTTPNENSSVRQLLIYSPFVLVYYGYRAMLRRARLWDCMSSVRLSLRPSVCPWRLGTVIIYIGILGK